MSIHRRDFLKGAGGILTGGLTAADPAFAASVIFRRETKRRARIAIFWEKDFPVGDGCAISRDTLQQAFATSDAAFLGTAEINSRLSDRWDLLVNPFGSCFPKECAETTVKYLAGGGSWLNIGGVPLAIPVNRDGTGWRKEIRQTPFHKRIGITQAFTVGTGRVKAYEAEESVDDTDSLINTFSAEEIFALYLRFTVTRDFPNEDGSAGARDAVVHPLVHAHDRDGNSIAAPIISIDRLLGEFAGGRWVFVTLRGTIDRAALSWLADHALHGSMELITRPSFACYQPGEIPSFTVQFRRPKGGVDEMVTDDATVVIRSRDGKKISTTDVRPTGYGILATGYGTPDLGVKLRPGFHSVETRIRLKSLFGTGDIRLSHRTGFWIHDRKMLEGGKPLGKNETHFLRDGEPFPVTGTTYMTSDVHRKFLFEPNPFIWDRDFSEMKKSGINMIRTGIWTGWKSAMLDAGAPGEAILRAMDAFLLTARTYDIPVIFTFFAFLPESWGGENVYLDPRSLRAQKEFVLAFVHRYRTAPDLIWDCINEPSFCNPRALWKCRPNYDRYESKAWTEWLRARYPAGSESEWSARLQEMFRSLPGEETVLPRMEEFNDANIFNDSRPVKVIDYRLFAQEMFTRWVREMAGTIRSNGNPGQMITVGQDEGGTYERPSPLFHHEPLDFTCLHNWWINDHLLWDNLMMKVPSKPMLVEETGLMFYENMDGSAWRTEEKARNLLERKLAISIAGGGAGFLEWIWNTNPYMLSDNEAAIGLHRADGSAKPELEPLVECARFYARHRGLMKGRETEEILMVIPHSQLFSTRNYATEATRRCVRTLTYRGRHRLRAASEYALYEIGATPRLIILPSARVLRDDAWQTLLRHVSGGAVMLVTGFIDADEHWMPASRLARFGLSCTTEPVAQSEWLTIDGTDYHLEFRDEKPERVEKAIVRDHTATPLRTGSDATEELRLINHGSGKIIWSPLPVELSDDANAIMALYGYAAREAGITPEYTVEPDDPSVLVLPQFYEKARFYTLISESDRDATIRLTDRRTGKVITAAIKAGRTRTDVIPIE